MFQIIVSPLQVHSQSNSKELEKCALHHFLLVEAGINLQSWVQFHQLTTLEELFRWEASNFHYGIITCQIPSSHDSSLLICLQPNTIKHLFILWKYLQHLYLSTQISIISHNTNDVLDFANQSHS